MADLSFGFGFWEYVQKIRPDLIPKDGMASRALTIAIHTISLRNRLKLSQRELAEKSDLRFIQIKQIESAAQKTNSNELDSLARALGVKKNRLAQKLPFLITPEEYEKMFPPA